MRNNQVELNDFKDVIESKVEKMKEMSIEKNQIIEQLNAKVAWLNEQNETTKKINAKLLERERENTQLIDRDRENDKRMAFRAKEQEEVIQQLEEDLKKQQMLNKKQ